MANVSIRIKNNSTGQSNFAKSGDILVYEDGSPVVDGKIPGNIVNATSNTNASVGDVVLADATSGAITVTLSTPSNDADMIIVKKIDSSLNAITIETQGSETIDGDSDQIISNQWTSATFIWSGSNWFLI